jgi:catechol-2,3-dioxygenase
MKEKYVYNVNSLILEEMSDAVITRLGQVMLYVNNQDEALKFWTEKLGFAVISETDTGQGMKWSKCQG